MKQTPAIFGGDPLFPPDAFDWPIQDPEVLDALQEAFRRKSWGLYDGLNCRELTSELCEYHRVPFVRLCCSGTIAVEIGLRSVGVKPGDEVILSAYDFAGNFRAISRIGATPVLVDIEPDTWSLSTRNLQHAISEKTRAIIASHLHGGFASIDSIRQIVGGREIAIVEDACQAHGAIISGRMAGTLGDVGVLSFGGSKLLSAGRGGAILTNNERYYQRAEVYCGQGNDAFAMSELQAVVLRPQLKKLDERNRTRFGAVRIIKQKLDAMEIETVRFDADNKPSFFKLPFLIRQPIGSLSIGEAREGIICAMMKEGVPVGPGFRGFVKRSTRRCRKPINLTEAEAASQGTILLHHPVLLAPPEEVERVAMRFNEIVNLLREGALPTS